MTSTAGILDTPTDWSSDGRYLAFVRTGGAGTNGDIWALPLFGERKPIALVQSPFNELNASFSRDARWVAYQSNESGQPQIYVQAFPTTGAKFQISTSGGIHPLWQPDGKELLFLSLDSTVMATTINPAPGRFEHGASVPLFEFAVPGNIERHVDVAADGRRFLVNAIREQSRTIPLTVIVNWLAAVQR